MTQVEIGRRIRIARLSAKMSQTELARAVGYSAANPISKLEAGLVAALDVVLLRRIAQATGVDLSFLVDGLDSSTWRNLITVRLDRLEAEVADIRRNLHFPS